MTKLPKVITSGRMTQWQYQGIHVWVKRRQTYPENCEICGEKRKLDWSNISGEYKKDLKDWRALCRTCHRRVDLIGNVTHCKDGHELTEENTYYYPNNGNKECRKCRRLKHQVSYRKRVQRINNTNKDGGK
jgi:hypothetical protein